MRAIKLFVEQILSKIDQIKDKAFMSAYFDYYSFSIKPLTLQSLFIAAISIPQASWSAQSLDSAINGALADNCSAIGTLTGPLEDLCAATGIPTSSTGGTIISPIGVTTKEKHLPSESNAEEINTNDKQTNVQKYDYSFGKLNLFVTTDFERHQKDQTPIEGRGFKSDKHALILGGDYRLNKQAVFGLAVNYSITDGNFDGSGKGGFDTDGYGMLLNGSFILATNWFLDAYLGYANFYHDIERYSNSVVCSPSDPMDIIEAADGVLSGNTESNRLRAGINLGYDFPLNSFVIGPRLSINYVKTDTDGYTETIKSGNPLPLVFYDQDEKSLATHLGIQVSKAYSWKHGVLVPQGMLDLIHEFDDDQRRINFSFVDDADKTQFTFNNDKPDRNYASLMLGVTAVFRDGLHAFVNYEGLLAYNDHTNHRFMAGIRLEL
jgi:uncharacterized protein YhjY with autotransporter beta-barrel domain